MQVSFFKSVKDTLNPYTRNVEQMLQRIKEGNSKELVQKIRECSSKDEQNVLKAGLCGVCFNGKFKSRSKKAILSHSGLIILDFDGFGSPSDADSFKTSLMDDKYTFACWISPSGVGVKALVRIPAEIDNHKGYFDKLKEHYNSEYWDESGSDVSRFCFESYDPDLYYNPESELWTDMNLPDVEDIGTTDPIIPITSENNIITNLLEWWNKKYGANKGSRNNNLYKLAVAFNDFGVNKSEAERVLFGFAEQGFPKSEIETLVKSAYSKVAQFNTKFFEDKQKQQSIEKLIRAGKTQKDIINSFDELPKDIVEAYSEKVKDNLDLDEFWEYNDKNKIKLSIHKFKYWLEQNGFYKFYPSKQSSTYTFVHKNQNMLEETDEKRIKDFTLKYIQNKPDIGYAPFDLMAGNTGYFKFDFLSMIDTINVNLKKDDKDNCYLYYKNCIVNVTKDNINTIDYLDVDSYIWKKQIIDREYNPFDHHKSEFRKFVWLIAGQNIERYNSFKSVIGYLLHSYKTGAKNKAIIFNDETISDNPNGRSGKGLFCGSLKHMKKVATIDGKQFDFKKSFPYQTVQTDTQLLLFDDVKKNFDFESLFSVITEGITLEYKNQNPIQVAVEDSPKILITTNYTIGGVGGSHEARKHEVELSSYFNSRHTPDMEFGHMLFSDWDGDEWSRFDNYMIQCVQFYLKNGLIACPSKNLEIRKFIKETSSEFYEWVYDKNDFDQPNIELNKKMSKTALYENFKTEHKDFEKWLKAKTFTKWLSLYADFKGYDMEEARDSTMRYVLFRDGEKLNIEDIKDDEVPF